MKATDGKSKTSNTIDNSIDEFAKKKNNHKDLYICSKL